MYLLYVDESGVTNPHLSQTSHFVMIGLAVHVGTWFALTSRVRSLKSAYALDGDTEKLELHAAWLLRAFREQSVISNFNDLSRRARYNAVQEWRKRRQQEDWPGLTSRAREREKKDFRKTEPFIHLTRDEREELCLRALAIVGDHKRGVTLFGQAVDKRALAAGVDAAEVAFSRLIDSFEIFLQHHTENPWGVVVVDNDQTQKDRYTAMLQRLQLTEHYRGGVDRIIEAPFFLDSRSNSGVQVADLCAFALRRYLENQEEQRFAAIFSRFHRAPGGGLCGLKHLTSADCTCKICLEPTENVSRRRRRRRRDTGPENADCLEAGAIQTRI
ncbi:MAG TPA: DUF3800 domain-containing protein [Thermoanaerobaculia bacterium]|jgi:hypothetical protein|nr:DUF3800 domain-containing protein [Thermoanaerobaculia bacterium]